LDQMKIIEKRDTREPMLVMASMNSKIGIVHPFEPLPHLAAQGQKEIRIGSQSHVFDRVEDVLPKARVGKTPIVLAKTKHLIRWGRIRILTRTCYILSQGLRRQRHKKQKEARLHCLLSVVQKRRARCHAA